MTESATLRPLVLPADHAPLERMDLSFTAHLEAIAQRVGHARERVGGTTGSARQHTPTMRVP
jgi:hypothetical protein